jgi:GT2 family glycosyltransferase
VRAATRHLLAEVWVVDNASTDGSVAALQPLFPEVHWIASTTNDGFARANNRALAQATGKWVLFLNPDTLVPEDCLEKCLQFAADNPDAGAMGVQMLDGSGQYLPESKRGFPGLWTSACKLLGLTAVFPKSALFARYYLGHLPAQQCHRVEVLAGAFMLVRRALLAHTGGFDERFFMYAEDIDLSYRLHKLRLPGQAPVEWHNYYVAHACIIHFKGESSSKGSLAHTRLFYKAMAQFVKKYYGGLRSAWLVGLLYLSIALRAMLAAAAIPIQRLRAGATEGKGIPAALAPTLWVAGSLQDKAVIEQIVIQAQTGKGATRVALLPTGPASLDIVGNTKQVLESSPVVWCISEEHPLSKVIDTLALQPPRRWWWHYRGSQSMVCSVYSTKAGVALSAMAHPSL